MSPPRQQEPVFWAAAAAAAQIPFPAHAAQTTSLYRSMNHPMEIQGSKGAQGLVPGHLQGNQVKWIAESPKYGLRTAPERTMVRFMVNTAAYEKFRKTLPFLGLEDTIQGYNRESDLLGLSNKLGRINVGVGPESIEGFNRSVYKVTAFKDPGILSDHRSLRFFQKNLAGQTAAGAFVVGIVLDGVSLNIAVRADGNKFGRNAAATTISASIRTITSPAVVAALRLLPVGMPLLAASGLGAVIAAIVSAGVSAAVLFGWHDPNDHLPPHVPSVNFDDIHDDIVLALDQLISPATVGIVDLAGDDLSFGGLVMDNSRLVRLPDISGPRWYETSPLLFGAGYAEQLASAIRQG